VQVSRPSDALAAQAAARGAFNALFQGLGVVALLVGGVGIANGALITAAYASGQGWSIVVPPVAVSGGIGGAILTGAVAGLYPALRAARLSPTGALRTA
jgi:putative ABC transport system permease protein